MQTLSMLKVLRYSAESVTLLLAAAKLADIPAPMDVSVNNKKIPAMRLRNYRDEFKHSSKYLFYVHTIYV
jgi:hypothetical protein